MNESESIAKYILECLFPGSVAHYREEQSISTHDFDLEYADGRVVPVEVTTSADDEWLRAASALRDPNKGGVFVARKCSKKDWVVCVKRGRSINRARAEVDQYLADVEREGLDRFPAPGCLSESVAVRRIYEDLGIDLGYTLSLNPPGRIALQQSAEVVRIAAAAVEAALLTEANKADNLHKLRAVDAQEPHLFVYVDSRNFAVWGSLIDDDPPPGIPLLPEGITHVWVAAPLPNRDEYVVWSATSSRPWQSARVAGPAIVKTNSPTGT